MNARMTCGSPFEAPSVRTASAICPHSMRTPNGSERVSAARVDEAWGARDVTRYVTGYGRTGGARCEPLSEPLSGTLADPSPVTRASLPERYRVTLVAMVADPMRSTCAAVASNAIAPADNDAARRTGTE